MQDVFETFRIVFYNILQLLRHMSFTEIQL